MSSNVVYTNLSSQTGGIVDYTTAWGYNGGTTGTSNASKLYTTPKLDPGKYAITSQVSSTVTVTSFVDVKASDKANE